MLRINQPRTDRLCAAVALALGGLLSVPAAQAASVVRLSALDGSNGFRLDGSALFEESGGAVSAAGDINGDGVDDLIIGADGARLNGLDSGSSYVVFGNSSSAFTSVINLSLLDGNNGFRLDGVSANDRSGVAVSAAGDINGDGIDDLIIGASGAENSGSSYVVFGRSAGGFSSIINLSTLDGSNGFRVGGVAEDDECGAAVSAAGDINGDGNDDLIIGAYGADPNGSGSGSSYVLFGRATGGFASVFQLSTLDGSNGFRLDGVATEDFSGFVVSAAGDINDDGIDDLIIGAGFADPSGDKSGSSYLVFGRSTGDFASVINLSLLDGSNGFRLDGVTENDRSGDAVSAAGDINGDGVDDLIIGAAGADSNGVNSGSSYVVFGRSTGGFASAIILSALDGGNGFRLDGVAAYDGSGSDVSGAGDVNGDGIGDLIIGAEYAQVGNSRPGSSFVVFGRSTGNFESAINLSTLDGNTGFRLNGNGQMTNTGRAVSAAGDINGDGTDDMIIGAPYANSSNFLTGSSYVVFGNRDPIFADGFGGGG